MCTHRSGLSSGFLGPDRASLGKAEDMFQEFCRGVLGFGVY